MAVVIPADALEYAAALIDKAIASVSNLHGFTHGTELTPGVTPDRFIRYDLVTGSSENRVGDRVEIRFQVWLEGPESERNRAAGIVLAQLLAVRGRKTSGPVSLPDPADAMKSLTQFTIQLLLIGVQQ